MIVADASACVLALLNDGEARAALLAESVAIPHLADSEVAHALRGQVLRESVAPDAAFTALEHWSRLGLRRWPVTGLLGRIWSLRENLSAYDATYVALAEALESRLLTADVRLAQAPGPTCAVTIVRR